MESFEACRVIMQSLYTYVMVKNISGLVLISF